jgi:hypothetical protein
MVGAMRSRMRSAAGHEGYGSAARRYGNQPVAPNYVPPLSQPAPMSHRDTVNIVPVLVPVLVPVGAQDLPAFRCTGHPHARRLVRREYDAVAHGIWCLRVRVLASVQRHRAACR